ncbi:valine--tRNA ligase [Qipengyuania aurantiaca]|uniref:Valine--tRNA ligase n=1 Tax=Qipengyuania aurantiaca TaxID=2867233 RepID=A0ABX8ZML6_9SPHN|nr:valine--tRNA ligase [Qipengyuania aurantiaca]QZD90227.1 valine--tRNA ligase [Qipengyuania aurantiaca]
MSTELSKTFDPAEIEQRWYAHWEENGLFRPERKDAEPFTIVNPPPNVTGSLHIGHALDNTLQDVVIRYERLRGKDALWVVGVDHAGIATQMVVERQMEAKQDKRTNYSREEFVDKVWEWKEESGGTITRQLRRLGCSMDWSREQFTMDEHFSNAVLKTFVDLYNDGLIYRDKRLVNWDPKLKTAISDLEVEATDVKGGFWHFKYPLADGVTTAEGKDYLVVATTRPETMLADMAVAVHPDDERYTSVVGKDILQPITGRRFKVVGDEHADPELGSGCVKITPGHDFNDFDVGKRAGMKPAEMLNMLDAEANVCQTADGLVPEEFLGLHRFKRDGVDGARELVVARMKELGFLIPHVTKDKEGNEVEHDAEPRTIATPFGDRGGVVIEPWLTDQWYVDAEKLARAPIEAVKDGTIEIVPKSWEKTFFNWMENIQPWCVSRQLWWGHRIPAWYDAEGKAYVAMTEEEAQTQAGDGVALTRDDDVLDTWFSSALWPFATLGWPDKTDLLDKHYPNDLLISGFDILFFWDARMMMQGMHLTGKAPWPRLYLHGLVRAADGAKMSKSKGNVVDPLGLIDQYGADALRFFMSAMESQGRDIKMDERRVEGYRNFATKLWNATRFCQSNGIGASTSIAAPEATQAVNKWIIGEVVETKNALEQAMADLRFDAAANTIYHFVWDRFCDWYIELIKGNFDEETKAVAGWALDQILVMLHPFMPFITEELWSKQGDRPDYPLITAKWPEPQAEIDEAAKAEIDWLIALTSAVRTAKNELGIAPGAKLEAYCPTPSVLGRKVVEENVAAIERLARLTPVHFAEAPGGAAMQVAAGEDAFIVPLEGVIDIEAEKARLTKAMEASIKEAKALEGRLGNANFVERAKPEAVEKARADHAHHVAEIDRLKGALARLG